MLARTRSRYPHSPRTAGSQVSRNESEAFESGLGCKGENDMKILISIFAAALALTFIGPTFAEEVPGAKTEAACQKAGGVWDAKTKVCSEKKSY